MIMMVLVMAVAAAAVVVTNVTEKLFADGTFTVRNAGHEMSRNALALRKLLVT